jgi:hypothetical protein
MLMYLRLSTKVMMMWKRRRRRRRMIHDRIAVRKT